MADERDEVMRADEVADLDPYGVRKPPVQQQAEELLDGDEEPAAAPADGSEDTLPPGTWDAPIPKPFDASFFKNKIEEDQKQIMESFKKSHIDKNYEHISKEFKNNYINEKKINSIKNNENDW